MSRVWLRLELIWPRPGWVWSTAAAEFGLMGMLADAVLAAGGDVIGVMPQYLVDGEIAHPGLTRLDVVGDMHQRKARMAELADAFLVLTGLPAHWKRCW